MVEKRLHNVLLERYRFAFVASLMGVLLFGVMAFVGWVSLGWLSLLCALFFLFQVLHYRNQLKPLNQFILTLPHDENNKIIDTTLFTQTTLYSWFYGKGIKINYEDIQRVQHNGNVFEISRPGYQGNHTVTVQSNQQHISLQVEGSVQANKILCFLKEKNPNIELSGLNSELHPVILAQLDNWNIKSRF